MDTMSRRQYRLFNLLVLAGLLLAACQPATTPSPEATAGPSNAQVGPLHRISQVPYIYSNSRYDQT